MNSFLSQIIAIKQADLIQKKRKFPLESLVAAMKPIQKNTAFFSAMTAPLKTGIALIAEVKLASPTSKQLGKHSEILERISLYQTGGADAISYVTEPHFFKGDIKDISNIKEKTTLPVLQKDFIIEAYQIYEAKNAGADALLLIAGLVDAAKLAELVSCAVSLGIEPVVEVFTTEELAGALQTSTRIIAVNARNLHTFAMNLTEACTLLSTIPDHIVSLGFSGISSSVEVEKYKKAGARGVLIGTELMRAKNIESFIMNLRTL